MITPGFGKIRILIDNLRNRKNNTLSTKMAEQTTTEKVTIAKSHPFSLRIMFNKCKSDSYTCQPNG
jgi:hypothetical protein